MHDKFRKLAAHFADSVIEQNAAIERHEPDIGNEFARRYIDASEALLNGGPGALAAFAELLTDDRIPVRVMAASYLLPHRTKDALSVLQAAAQGRGITALGARMTLQRWEEGGKRSQ